MKQPESPKVRWESEFYWGSFTGESAWQLFPGTIRQVQSQWAQCKSLRKAEQHSNVIARSELGLAHGFYTEITTVWLGIVHLGEGIVASYPEEKFVWHFINDQHF